jgi:lysophospholipase L1-like esterase
MTAAIVLGGCGSTAPTAGPLGPSVVSVARAADSAGPTSIASIATPTRIASSTPAGPSATLPGGPLTIAALGDSLTEGQGDDSGAGGYPGRLQALLDTIRPGSRIDNFGHSGWSSSDAINGQNGEPAELTQAIAANPDVALVWIGSNDLWYLYEFGPEPMTAEAEQADLAEYEANVDTILHDLTSHGATVLIALLDDQSKRPVVANPPNPAEPAFPGTTAADLALMSAHVHAYNDILVRKAAEYGATTVDFFDTTIFTDAATLYGDGNHPNAAGYDLVGQIWFTALRAALK